jgi:hypothetical protein
MVTTIVAACVAWSEHHINLGWSIIIGGFILANVVGLIRAK